MIKKAIDFIPEDLKHYEFYQKFCDLIDWIVETYYTTHLSVVEDIYNDVGDKFDPEYIFDMLGVKPYKEAIFDPLIDIDSDRLAHFISRVYNLKGTRKGLELVLKLMGLDGTIYEWFQINEMIAQGDFLWEDSEEFDPCTVALLVYVGNYAVVDDYEAKFIEFAALMLWACVKLDSIIWVKQFEENVEIDDLYEDEITQYIDDYYDWNGSLETIIRECSDLPTDCFARIGDATFQVGEGIWHGGQSYTCGNPVPVIIGPSIYCGCVPYIGPECWDTILELAGRETTSIEIEKIDYIQEAQLGPVIGTFIIEDEIHASIISGFSDHATATITDDGMLNIGDGWDLGPTITITDIGAIYEETIVLHHDPLYL